MTPPATPSTSLSGQGFVSHIKAGQQVLTIEAQALHTLAESLGADFEAACKTLAGVKGRVIVTGMGKSGHVGRKIAATLASTGTPAFFVHPAEASHGDLGMIARADAVIALSNSGETAELADVLGYTRRHDIPLVAITSRAGSTLARTADHLLLLPPVPEACPLGLAPTTSTTLMLALGDALAVALLEAQGFTAADFQSFHPGGALGKRLLVVRDLMHAGTQIPLIDAEASMKDALLVISEKSFGCVGIVDDGGRLQGIVTDGDLRRHMSATLLDKMVKDVMSGPPRTIRESALGSEALWLMNSRKITSLFVTADEDAAALKTEDGGQAGGTPLGILHVHDLLRAGLT